MLKIKEINRVIVNFKGAIAGMLCNRINWVIMFRIFKQNCVYKIKGY